jgi:BlaI family penicillinase repressor
MAKKSFAPLGETELELLQHVWELERATVADVHKRVLETREVAYTTVMNVMRKLADKGYLEYERQGAAYVYSPAQSAQQVRASILKEIMDKAFRGSPVSLVQTLVKRGRLSPEERAEILRLIREMNGADREAAGEEDA